MQIKKKEEERRVKERETFFSTQSIPDSWCAVPGRHDAITYNTYSASENISVF